MTFRHLFITCHEVWNEAVPEMAWRSRPKYLSTLSMTSTPAILLMLAFVLWFIASESQISCLSSKQTNQQNQQQQKF